MVESIKKISNFFSVFGLSWKKYSAEERLSSRCLAVWSSLAVIVFLSAVIFAIYSLWDLTHVNWEITIQMMSMNFCSVTACVIFGWSFIGGNQEEAFWKVVRNAGLVDRNAIESFMKQTAFKIAAVMTTLILQFSMLILVLLLDPNIHRIAASLLAFADIAVCRMHRLKFIIFMDILHLHLKQLRLRCEGRVVHKRLKQSINVCWTLSRISENIFGFPMLLTWTFVFIATISNAFNICTVLYKDGLSLAAIFNSLLIVAEIFFVADACQKCKNTLSLITTTIFSENSRKFHVEALILKLHHQRIAFDTSKIINVDRKFIVSVSLKAPPV